MIKQHFGYNVEMFLKKDKYDWFFESFDTQQNTYQIDEFKT